MRTFKRFLAMFLVICISFCICPVTPTTHVEAARAEIPAGYYRIVGYGSGKYLDITDVSKDNGAELQIWEKFPYHQNQIFLIAPVDDYYVIISYNSLKAIEVRNSSTDDGGTVAQWEYVGIPCQQWYIESNGDGTVSFVNRNSGKYMDVSGNGTENGTKVIQYESNGTTAQKFVLNRLFSEDIKAAAWNIKTSEIASQKINPLQYKRNRSGYYVGQMCAPIPGRTYLTKMEYIDANIVLDLICEKGMDDSAYQKLADLYKSELKEEIVAEYFDYIGLEVRYVGIKLGVLEILESTADKSGEDYQKFVAAARRGRNDGSVNAIIRKTYVTFNETYSYEPLNNGTANWGTYTDIVSYETHEFEVWSSASQIVSPSNYSGIWNYNFE